MRLNIIGNFFLIVAFLLACAGIVEPSTGSSVAVAAFLFAGFAIITQQSHNTWSAGYKAAQLDMSFSRQRQREDALNHLGQWKCGQSDCHCKNDSQFREVRL